MTRKVLLLDEDKLVQATVGAWLEKHGFQVSPAISCDEAENLAESEKFDVLMVDMQWPCLQGIQKLTRLKKLLPGAAIVAISEFTDRELEEEARTNGAGWFLTKPLDLEELAEVLESTKLDDVRPESGFLPGSQIEQTLLRGFSPDEQWDFRMTGNLRSHKEGELIPLGDEASSLIWVEQGEAEAFLGGVLLDRLAVGDFWGEETFVNPGTSFVQLLASENCQIRHFNRKRLIDFFAYHEETLTKRYMLNLIFCLQHKWKRNLNRLVKKLSANINTDQQ
ncbi:MAG: response regulator [Candidatus Cloacimonetes bacterium]|nr:response regulator [Candidatus Cloacimonadota bacterium]